MQTRTMREGCLKEQRAFYHHVLAWATLSVGSE